MSTASTSPQSTKVAMLVHNGVLKDARVIKAATSLADAGYQVEIHGITNAETPAALVLPGTDIPVFLEPRALLLESSSHWRILARLVNRLERAARNTLNRVPWAGWRVRRLLRAVRGQLERLAAWGSRRKESIGETPFPQEPPRHLRPLANALALSVERRPTPDMFHLHDHVALSLARRLKTQFGARILWDAHEIYEDLASENPERSAKNAAVIAAQQDAVDAFITISDSIAGFYTGKYPGLGRPHVVMNATFPSTPPIYDGRLHAAASLPATQKILLFQGGFAEKRGLRRLLAAAPKVNPEWTVVLMGWGALEDELRKIAAATRRQSEMPAVVFLPGVPHEELQIWSAGAALGAIPYENTSLNHLYCTPNKLWEYPDAGVPVLATDLEEMGPIIRESGIGFLLPRDFNECDIVEIVNGLTDDALAEARRRCRPFIETNNWQTWVPNLLAAYEAARGAPTHTD